MSRTVAGTHGVVGWLCARSCDLKVLQSGVSLMSYEFRWVLVRIVGGCAALISLRIFLIFAEVNRCHSDFPSGGVVSNQVPESAQDHGRIPGIQRAWAVSPLPNCCV